MATARLRIFPRPEEDDREETTPTPAIAVRLLDLYPLLAQAHRDNFTWLDDFADDTVLVSRDLYEVVRAFANYRPSA